MITLPIIISIEKYLYLISMERKFTKNVFADLRIATDLIVGERQFRKTIAGSIAQNSQLKHRIYQMKDKGSQFAD